MKDVIFFVVFVLAIIWGFYRCFKTKNERLLYALVLFCSLQLYRYPLYWPIEFVWSIWSFLGFLVITYKILYQKLDKSLMVFAVVFLGFGVIFLLQGLLGDLPHEKF